MESIETVIIIFIVGLSVLLIGVYTYNKRRYLLRSGIRVEGVVSQLIIDGDSYYPVVRFLTATKVWITEKYVVAANRWTYKEGQTVQVIYDPLNPGRFILEDGQSKNTAPGFILSGVLLIIISVGLLVLGLRG